MDSNNLNLSQEPKSSSKFPQKLIFGLIIFILLVALLVALAYIRAQKDFINSNLQPTEEITASADVANQADNEIVGTRALVEGMSLVAPDNKVLADNFEAAQNSAVPNSPEAPKSVAILIEDLPKEVLNLKISDNKITPDSFTVNTGALISLAVTSADNETHVFGFYDGDLGAIAMGINPGQTKVINFNAPASGVYHFGCGVPQHTENGEQGKMIVK